MTNTTWDLVTELKRSRTNFVTGFSSYFASTNYKPHEQVFEYVMLTKRRWCIKCDSEMRLSEIKNAIYVNKKKPRSKKYMVCPNCRYTENE